MSLSVDIHVSAIQIKLSEYDCNLLIMTPDTASSRAAMSADVPTESPNAR